MILIHSFLLVFGVYEIDTIFFFFSCSLKLMVLILQLDRVSSIAAKYIGRPISQLPPVQPIHISSLDLSMGSFGAHAGLAGPSLDLDLLPGSSSTMPNVPYQPACLSDMDKSLMSDIASNAMEELLRLLQTNEPLWMKSSTDGRDVLNLDTYERMFPKANSHLKNPNVRIEASRDSGVVIMNGLTLVDMFMDPVRCSYLQIGTKRIETLN